MILTEQLKSAILAAIHEDFRRKKAADDRQNKTRHANHLGINPSVYSRLINGETDRIISEGEWIRIGMELCVNLNGLDWQPAKTATYSLIHSQLQYCRENGMSAIFCDDKGIGKTFAGRSFATLHPNVAYIDCSRCHTKPELIRKLARMFGFDYKGRLGEIRDNMIENILTLDKPLIILDEAGDLSYEAFLFIKSLWNSLEYMCGFYMMGANGLKAKIDRQMTNAKVGYEEIFDRFGGKYQAITKKLTEAEKATFLRHQAETVLRANLPGITKAQQAEILNACYLNLRRLPIEIVKFKNQPSPIKNQMSSFKNEMSQKQAV